MSDIYGYKRSPKPYGVFSTEGSKLTIGSADATKAAYLVQNWTISYSQDVQELFEIGSDRLYWVKGRPMGQGGIGRIVGATDPNVLMPKGAFDICDGGATMTLKSTGGHCENPPTHGGAGVALNKGVSLTMMGCVVTTIGFSMSLPDVKLAENYAWRFGYLNVGSK